MNPQEDLDLPCLRNGVLTIGDFFDCRAGKRLGVNLFGQNLATSEIEDLLEVKESTSKDFSRHDWRKDANSSANNIGIGASAKADIIGGAISLEGGLDYELGWSKGSSTEELDIMVVQSNVTVNFKQNLPVDKKLMDANVKDQLKQGKYPALTHIVTGIEIGGTLFANTKITQQNKGMNYKMGFFVDATVPFYIVSLKFALNASVGQEIVNNAYELQMRVTSMPPIPPPRNLSDFRDPENDDDPKGPDNFSKELTKQTHFPEWDTIYDKISDKKIKGIPIKFHLEPWEKVVGDLESEPEESENDDPGDPIIEEPEETENEDGEPEEEQVIEEPEVSNPEFQGKSFNEVFIKPINCQPIPKSSKLKPALKNRIQNLEKNTKLIDAELNNYSSYMSDLYLWRGEDYLRSQLLQENKRSLKILSEPTHILNMETGTHQENIKRECNRLLISGGAILLGYKADYNLPIFADGVQRLRNEWAKMRSKIESYIEDLKPKIASELSGLNLDPYVETDEDNPDWGKEDTSPLQFFTNESELLAWRGSRHTRLLYRCKTNDDYPKPLHPQRISNLSNILGANGIYPGIAYPSLLHEDKTNELLSIQTIATKVSYNINQKESVALIIDILEDCLVEKSSKSNNIYNCLCEINGAKLDFSDQRDFAMLLGQVETFLSKSTFCRTIFQMRAAVQATKEEWVPVFNTEGAVTIHSVVSYMKSLESSEMICGTFAVNNAPSEIPLFFLAKDGGIKGVCLDHLDTLILKSEESKTQIPRLLDIEINFEISPIALEGRVEFVRALRIMGWDRSDQVIQGIREVKTMKNSTYGSEISAAILLSKLSSPKQFVDAATYFIILENSGIISGSNLKNWQLETNKFVDGLDSDGWNAVSLSIGEIADKAFPLKVVLNELINNMQSVAMTPEFEGEPEPVPLPEPVPDPKPDPEPEVPFPKRFDLDNLVTQFMDYNTRLLNKDFMDRINFVQSIKFCHLRAYAKLFVSLGLEEFNKSTVAKEHRDLFLLKRLIEEIAADSNVSEDRMLLFLRKSLTQIDKGIWEMDCGERRFYSLAQSLRESNPEFYVYKFQELVVLQTALKKLVSVDDWYGLRLLTAHLDQHSFRAVAQEVIWGNPKFLFLIRRNIQRAYVLTELRRIYVTEQFVPPYIPRDIREVLLGSATNNPIDDDGNEWWSEIEIPSIWEDPAHVLQLFKRIVVTQKIPKVFMRSLLNNVSGNEELRKWFEDVKGLLYWDRVDEIFEEPWGLKDIEDVIETTINGNGSKFLTKGPQFSDKKPIQQYSVAPVFEKTPQSISQTKLFHEEANMEQIANIFDSYPKETHMDLLRIVERKGGTLPLILPATSKGELELNILPILKGNEKDPMVITFINSSDILNQLLCKHFSKSSDIFAEYLKITDNEKTVFIINATSKITENKMCLDYIKSMSSSYYINCGPEEANLLRIQLKPDTRIHTIKVEIEGNIYIQDKLISNIHDLIKHALENHADKQIIGIQRSFIPPNSLEKLMLILSKTTAENLKRTLIFHMAHEPVTKPELQIYYEKNPIYRTIIGEITRLLSTEISSYDLQLLKEVLADLNQESRAIAKKAFDNFLSQNDNEWMAKYPMKEKQNVLGYFFNEMHLNQITVSDLILETCSALEIMEHEAELDQVLQGVRRHLIIGNELEVPISKDLKANVYFEEVWAQKLLQNFENDGKFLFVTIIGTNLDAIWKVVETITGIHCEEIIISDFMFKILIFDKELREETEISGIVLILFQPVAEQRFYKQSKYEVDCKRLCSFLISNCNLSIVADSNQQFFDLLEISVIDVARIEDNSDIFMAPNFIFYDGELENLELFLDNCKSNLTKLRTFAEFGTNSQNVWDRTQTVLKRGFVVFKKQDEIINILKDLAMENKYRCLSISQYFEKFRENWSRIESYEPFEYENFADYEITYNFEKLLDPVHLSIDDAYSYHLEGLEQTIFQGLTELLAEEEQEKESSYLQNKNLLVDELSVRFHQILNECIIEEDSSAAKIESITSKWKQGKSFSKSNCLRIEEEIKGRPCKYCTHQSQLEDELLDMLPGEIKGTAFSELRKHENVQREHCLLLLTQMMDAQEIIVLENSRDKGLTSKQELSQIQEVSLKRLIPNSSRRMKIEQIGLLPYATKMWDSQPKIYATFDELCRKEQAFAENSAEIKFAEHIFLHWAETAWLKHNQRVIVERALRRKEIYQNGIVRQIVAEIDAMFTKFTIRFQKNILGSFKAQVLNFSLLLARNKLGVSESRWNQEFEPITVWRRYNF